MKAFIHALWTKQWIRFLLIGALNTSFGYGAYVLMLALGASYLIGSLGSIIVGVMLSFHTHSSIVFRSTMKGAFWRYLTAWALLYLGNVVFIGWMIQAGLNAYGAGLLAIMPSAMLSYLLQRLFVFRDTMSV